MMSKFTLTKISEYELNFYLSNFDVLDSTIQSVNQSSGLADISVDIVVTPLDSEEFGDIEIYAELDISYRMYSDEIELNDLKITNSNAIDDALVELLEISINDKYAIQIDEMFEDL